MKQKALILLLAVLIFYGPAALGDSQSQSPDTNNFLNLPDYLQYAAHNNSGLKAAFHQWKSALEAVPQARSLPDPKFTYGYFINEVETRVGPQKNKFSLMQTFPWFGKIEARTDAAALAAKAARKRYEAAKLALFFKVKNVFYEYTYLGRSVEIARQNLELSKHFEEVARTKYTTAAGSHPDIIRAQIELATLADKLQSLQQMQEPLVARLNSALNRKPDMTLPWPSREQFKPVQINQQEVIARLISNNPELKALGFDQAAAKARLELAKKKFYPDISAGVDWIQTDDAIMSGTDDSGKDPIIAMFSINLPIWTDNYKAAQRQARANLRKASSQKKQKQNEMTAQALMVLYEFQDSSRKVALYKDILIPKAKEMLQASEGAYRTGSIDFLSLINSQQTLLEFELSYERSVTDNLQRLAELEELMGIELTDNSLTKEQP